MLAGVKFIQSSLVERFSVNWLRKIFKGKEKSVQKVACDKPNKTMSFSLDDESYHANEDVLEGIQFAPPLQIATSLEALIHFGEVFDGPFSSAPSYGGHSFWVPKVKDEFSLFSNHEPSVASEIGPVKPSTYLPFLIAFREIIESDLSDVDKKIQIEGLRDESESFRAIWDDLDAKSSMFPFGYIDGA